MSRFHQSSLTPHLSPRRSNRKSNLNPSPTKSATLLPLSPPSGIAKALAMAAAMKNNPVRSLPSSHSNSRAGSPMLGSSSIISLKVPSGSLPNDDKVRLSRDEMVATRPARSSSRMSAMSIFSAGSVGGAPPFALAQSPGKAGATIATSGAYARWRKETEALKDPLEISALLNTSPELMARQLPKLGTEQRALASPSAPVVNTTHQVQQEAPISQPLSIPVTDTASAALLRSHSMSLGKSISQAFTSILSRPRRESQNEANAERPDHDLTLELRKRVAPP